MYCISLKLARKWAALGINYRVEQSFGNSFLVTLLAKE